jgi:hypothetical protein
MRRITFEPLEVRRDGMTCRFRVEPASDLYRGPTCFTLRLPAGYDGRQLAPGLWWSVVLLCLHSHWTLLGPCTVCLPVRLPPGHGELWRRLLASERTTLAAYRQGGAGAAAGDGDAGGVGGVGEDGWLEWREEGPALAEPARLVEAGRCAAAFSGGKDSLVQAGLLCELGVPLVLVPTTSPMPPLHDHETARRRHVLAEIARRRDVEVAEVASDLRSLWRNDFPPSVGYPVAVNEITDTFLYTAALLVVGVLGGATHLFLASEAEVQESIALADGGVVQHTHFMYSAATQRAIAALLAPLGVRYGSLISALYSAQVQTLLWTRYGDLRDLQYSCWRVPATGGATCSACSQCLRLALTALALGDNPQRMGIDLAKLLVAMRDWSPAAPLHATAGGALLPSALIARRLRRQSLRSLAATPTARVAGALAMGGPLRLVDPASWRALAAYARLRRRLVLGAPGGAADLLAEVPRYRAGFLRQLDPLLRSRIAAIFDTHFAAEPPAEHAAVQARGDALAAWITAPLAAARGEMAPGVVAPAGMPPDAAASRIAKYWLDPVTLAASGGFSAVELRAIWIQVIKHREDFLEAWNEFFSGG